MRKKHMHVFLSIIIVLSLFIPVTAFGGGIVCGDCENLSDTVNTDKDRDYKGIDVSVYQGDIDFEEVKDSGIDAVYIRAGEGNNIIDSYFEKNYRGAMEEGLHYGFYHYVTARNVEEAKEQAEFFANLIKSKPYDMKAAMDFENLSGLTAEESIAIAETYLKELQNATGHSPVVYSDSYDAAAVWKSHLNEYTLWVADYGVSRPYSIGGWQSWGGFQYSDKGSVKGINGHVDLDIFNDEVFLTSDEQKSTKYTVCYGDTLWEIAERFETTIDELVIINNIQNPDLIYWGQELLIPH